MTQSTPPQVHCTCCQQIMTAIFQPGLINPRGAYLVTCENRNCPMYGFTLAEATYPPTDLDKYLKGGQQRLLARQGYGEIALQRKGDQSR